MNTTSKIVVLGGGPTGTAAAIEAARTGASVRLITNQAIGGRATLASYLPSKVLIERFRSSDFDLARLQARISELSERESQRLARRLEDAGVRVLAGRARFESSHSIRIERDSAPRVESFDAAIIATGSVPYFPPGFLGSRSGPDGTRIFAARHLRTLSSLPKTLLAVGGGATGAELVSAMLAARVEITWLLDEYGILPDFDRELADSLGDVLMERGVKIVHGKKVESLEIDGEGVKAKLEGGRTYSAERAFVAIGRRPDLAELNVEAAGLERDVATGRIYRDRQFRTSQPHILVVGDAAGPPYLANRGVVEGWLAARFATSDKTGSLETPAPTSDNDSDSAAHESALEPYGPFVHAVYSDPEVASVGLRVAEMEGQVEVRTISFDESVLGHLHDVGFDPHARGTLRLVLDAASHRILGASAIGPHAAEVLGPIALAIQTGCRVEQLAISGFAAPTYGELAGRAARS